MSDTGVRWGTLLAEATQRLEAAGLPSPAVDARRIVEEATGAEPVELAAELDRPATVGGVTRFDRMLERRSVGEPLQYVLGRWSFRTLDLLVDRRVLIPRPETEVVAGYALAELDGRAAATPLVADLGTGSGAIALSIAVEHPSARVWASDASAAALEVARANLAGIGRPGSRVTLVEGSWFEALPTELAGTLAVVVSNPPYVARNEELPAEVRDWEPTGALVAGPTGLEAIEELLAGAGAWLAPGGALVLELAPHQSDAARRSARAHGYASVEIGSDLAGRDRVIVARRPPV